MNLFVEITGAFTYAALSQLESDPGGFSPLVRFVYACTNPVVTLRSGPKRPYRFRSDSDSANGTM